MRSVTQALAFLLAGHALVAAQELLAYKTEELRVSHDGTCGNGTTCYGSQFGGCCSVSGSCGSTKDYCGQGCQIGFGYCHDTVGQVSPDGTCGGSQGYICEGSVYGSCCSQHLYCGSGPDYCGSGNTSDDNPLAPVEEPSVCSVKTITVIETAASEVPEIAPVAPTPYPDDSVAVSGTTLDYAGTATGTANGIATGTATGTAARTATGSATGIATGPGAGPGNVSGTSSGTSNGTIIGTSTGTFIGTPSQSSSGVSTGGHSSDGPRTTQAVSITAITPTLIPSSANPSASSLASASASASACAYSFHKRQESTEFRREETEENCIPCDGQGGSLPYCGADHTVDNYKFTPKTCRTVYYNLDITNTTLAPDGISRIALTVNGQLPGPLIEANWGDTVIVTVNNKLQDNGTSIHFHGIRQLNNSEYDGVPAITQCPIAPGDSMTYKWTATNYGTSWYHSHYAIQAWEGVVGPMIIHGPTSASWDEDLGTVMLQDWSHRTVDSMYDMEQDAVNGGPRIMDNGLINGKNTWGVQGTTNQTGERFEFDKKFEPGKTYLIRIINAAIQATFKFYIDEHELEVINMDFTNIVPYKTNIVNIHIGQRYMLLVKAKAKPGNYWMRADNQRACSGNLQADDIKGIIRYADAPDAKAVPTSTAYNYTGQCVDEPLASLVPTAPLNAFGQTQEFQKDITVSANADHMFRWYLSGTTFYSKYEDPTLVRVMANNSAPTYSGNLILDLPNMGEWVYIIVQSAIPVAHPIHLHGHDFLILGTGHGKYTDQPLNHKNPPRRDTASMPAAGWLALAFETDNPGAWLMHCHIGWHTSMGFALQILEGKSLIKKTVKDECALYGTCAKWNQWVEARGFKQHDSGV